MYDDFSADYDRFVDWPARLAAELPFIEQQLQSVEAQGCSVLTSSRHKTLTATVSGATHATKHRLGSNFLPQAAPGDGGYEPKGTRTEQPWVEARRVLDAACGTGMHVIALAQCGYEAAGADLSAGMIERARANADAANSAAGVDVRFEVAGFGELARAFGSPSAASGFDAVLCLGNSLSHLLTPEALAAALADFAACLRPGGLLLIQNRNFDAVLARREQRPEPVEGRWMEPQSRREGETEWLFLRFYDFEPDGALTFNLATLRREGAGAWQQKVTSTRLWPLTKKELTAALAETGFADVACYGDMTGAPFDAARSPNLVVTARP